MRITGIKSYLSRTLFTFLLLFLSPFAWADVALVQAVGLEGGDDTDTSIAFTVSSTGTTDTVLVMCLGSDSGGQVTGVTDNGSNTWTQRQVLETASVEGAALFTASGTGAATTITVALDSNIGTAWAGAVYEFSGADASSISSNGATVIDSTSHSSGAVTAESGGAMVGCYGGNTDDFDTGASPWNIAESRAGATNTECTGPGTMDCRAASEYRLVTTGASLSYDVTAGASNRDSAIAVLEIGPAGGGGGGSTIVPHWVRELKVHQ